MRGQGLRDQDAPVAVGKAPTGARGFTLIEVLITLVILSTGIVVVLQAFQSSATALDAGRDSMRAAFLLRQTIEQAERDGLTSLPPSGACPEPYDMYARQIRAESAGGATPEGAELTRLRVDVFRRDSSTIYSQTTFLYPHYP